MQARLSEKQPLGGYDTAAAAFSLLLTLCQSKKAGTMLFGIVFEFDVGGSRMALVYLLYLAKC
jgi:hypothetical protein